jgi:hypothetical protein
MVRPLPQRLHTRRQWPTIHLLQRPLPGKGMATSPTQPEIDRQSTLTPAMPSSRIDA